MADARYVGVESGVQIIDNGHAGFVRCGERAVQSGNRMSNPSFGRGRHAVDVPVTLKIRTRLGTGISEEIAQLAEIVAFRPDHMAANAVCSIQLRVARS